MKYAPRFILIVSLSLFLIPAKAQEAVKDYNGNVYITVKIGASLWMAENLKVTHYSNGEPIPNIKDSKQWDLLLSGAYCDFNNNPSYSKAFGLLYNWYTVADVRNVCPGGWHVPSENEWGVLISVLAGGNEKSTDLINAPGKISPGLLKLNESMFKLLPEGFRGYDGEFTGIGYGGGGWWSGTECTKETAIYHNVNYNTAGNLKMEGPKRFAYHIRCVKNPG